MAGEKYIPNGGGIGVNPEQDVVDKAFYEIVDGLDDETEVTSGDPDGRVDTPEPFDKVAAYFEWQEREREREAQAVADYLEWEAREKAREAEDYPKLQNQTNLPESDEVEDDDGAEEYVGRGIESPVGIEDKVYRAAREFFVRYNHLVIAQRTASNAEETLIINTSEGPSRPSDPVDNAEERSGLAQKARLAVMSVMDSMEAHRDSVGSLIKEVNKLPKEELSGFFTALDDHVKMLEHNQKRIEKHAAKWRRINEANKKRAKKQAFPKPISVYEGLTTDEANQAREILNAIEERLLVKHVKLDEQDKLVDVITIPGVDVFKTKLTDVPLGQKGRTFDEVSQFTETAEWKEQQGIAAAEREQRIAYIATILSGAALDGFKLLEKPEELEQTVVSPEVD